MTARDAALEVEGRAAAYSDYAKDVCSPFRSYYAAVGVAVLQHALGTRGTIRLPTPPAPMNPQVFGHLIEELQVQAGSSSERRTSR